MDLAYANSLREVETLLGNQLTVAVNENIRNFLWVNVEEVKALLGRAMDELEELTMNSLVVLETRVTCLENTIQALIQEREELRQWVFKTVENIGNLRGKLEEKQFDDPGLDERYDELYWEIKDLKALAKEPIVEPDCGAELMFITNKVQELMQRTQRTKTVQNEIRALCNQVYIGQDAELESMDSDNRKLTSDIENLKQRVLGFNRYYTNDKSKASA